MGETTQISIVIKRMIYNYSRGKTGIAQRNLAGQDKGKVILAGNKRTTRPLENCRVKAIHLY
jgi:hypothetical protein